MIGNLDFWVSNVKENFTEDLAVLDDAFLGRNRYGKNTMIVHTGRSREGKSGTTEKEIEELLKYNDVDYLPFVDAVNVYTPLELATKLNNILYNHELKDIPFLVIDDARFAVGSKDWHTFLNRSVADILSISGRQRPLTVFFNTQFLRDIDTNMRGIMDFWGECYRPRNKPVDVKYVRFYEDTRNPEDIKIRKRNMRGIVIRDEQRILRIPKKFTLTMPSTAVWKKYDASSYKAKGSLIQFRLNKMMDYLKTKYGMSSQLDSLVNFYAQPKNIQALEIHLLPGKKPRLRKEAYEVLRISKDEGTEFLKRISEIRKKEVGLFGNEQRDETVPAGSGNQ